MLQAAATTEFPDGALRAVAAAERLRRELGATAERTSTALQPTAAALGAKLKLPAESVSIFAEEVRLC